MPTSHPRNSENAPSKDYDLQDNQQRYDDSTQEFATGKGTPEFDRGFARENFARDFYRYSKNYRDNDFGAPGVDEDYGNYQSGEDRWRGERPALVRSPSHAGRGPKGYKRSDDRIREEVNEALTHDHHVDASDIEVVVDEGIVSLKGTVINRRMKRLAEDCVEGVTGVLDVHNLLLIPSTKA